MLDQWPERGKLEAIKPRKIGSIVLYMMTTVGTWFWIMANPLLSPKKQKVYLQKQLHHLRS